MELEILKEEDNMYKTNSAESVLKLKNDFLFKVVYGSDTEESKTILKSLLNKILDREEDPIVNIEYKNPFQLREHADDKETILDIKAEVDSKELIDIEMQIIWDKDMHSRLLAYHGGLLREALHGERDYAKMKQTITVCIVDSIVFPETENFLTKFYLMEEQEHFKFSSNTRIYCIELPKVNRARKPVEKLSPLEICLEYLKYADEIGSRYLDELILRGGKELEMTDNILKKAAGEELLREKALAREKYLNDQVYWSHRYEHGLEDGRKQGLEDGRKQGLEDGRKQGFEDGMIQAHKESLQRAKLMKEDGLSDETVAKYTGLTLDEICSL